jgi:hypothetical protein
VNCEEFELALQECLDIHEDIDQAIESDPLMIAHSEQCELCMDMVGSFKVLSSGIDAMRNEEWSFECVDQIVPVREVVSINHTATRLNMFKIAAIAAGLIIVVTLASFYLPSNEKVAIAPQVPARLFERDDLPPPGLLRDSAPPGSITDTRSSAEIEIWTRQLALLSKAEFNDVERIAQTIDAWRPYYIYTQQLPGVKPVSSSLTITVDVLRRSIENQKNPDDAGRPDAYFRYAKVNWV